MQISQHSGRWILVVAALLGAAGLLLNAGSAHALKSLVSQEALPRLLTANRYLTHYSLVLLVIGVFYQFCRWPGLQVVAGLFTVGAGIFCGSLYILCLLKISWLAWATPLGGLTLLSGWLLLAWIAWRQGRGSND